MGQKEKKYKRKHSSYNLTQSKQRRKREKPTYLINLAQNPWGSGLGPTRSPPDKEGG
jgi:hypothetical protein